MHPGLCKLFRTILQNENEDIDVLDRAGYYYNILKNDISAFKDIMNEVKETDNKLNKENQTQKNVNTLIFFSYIKNRMNMNSTHYQ